MASISVPSSPYDIASPPPLPYRVAGCSPRILTTAPCTGTRAAAKWPCQCKKQARCQGTCPRALPSALAPVNPQVRIFNVATALAPGTDANLMVGDTLGGGYVGVNNDSPGNISPSFLNALTSPSIPYPNSDIASPNPALQPFLYQVQRSQFLRRQNPLIYLSGKNLPRNTSDIRLPSQACPQSK